MTAYVKIINITDENKVRFNYLRKKTLIKVKENLHKQFIYKIKLTHSINNSTEDIKIRTHTYKERI